MNTALSFFLNLRLFKALTHRPIFILWTGEAFSAIGDEVYKVALVWLAVKMVGADAGYLSAAQAGAVLIFGLTGGIWADHWDPRKTMFNVDIIRGLIVLIPVVWAYFYPLNLTILIIVAVSVAAMGAFFDPALQAVVPRLARNRELMQATNGLMGTTARLARAVGPGIVGTLTGILPTIHFFTLDALSFGASAYAIAKLKKQLPFVAVKNKNRMGILEGLMSGFDSIRGDSVMKYVIYAKTITTGTWCVVIPLGMALLIQAMLPGDVRAYGFLMASYGVGNLAGALVLANIAMQRPMRTMGLGFIFLGIGFLLMAATHSLTVMMIGAAFAAIGGPMNDLAHIDVIQRRFPPESLVRVVRFRMAMECGGMLICLTGAPLLFKILSAQWVVAMAGTIIGMVGIVGIIFFRERSA